MNKLETNIHEIILDLNNLKLTREEFIAKCACDKIESRSQLYSKQFDQYLSQVENSEIYCKDISRLGTSLKSLSKLITSSYDSLIKMIKRNEKNIFGKKD